MGQIDDFRKSLEDGLDMEPEQLSNFKEASNHPYECTCKICKEWWELMGPEPEIDDSDEYPQPDSQFGVGA